MEKAAGRCRQRKLVLVRFCRNWVVLKIPDPFSLVGSAWKRISVFWVIYPRPSSCGISPVRTKVGSYSSTFSGFLLARYSHLLTAFGRQRRQKKNDSFEKRGITFSEPSLAIFVPKLRLERFHVCAEMKTACRIQCCMLGVCDWLIDYW